MEYVLTASDMRPIFPTDLRCKYADDTYVLVQAINMPSIPQEIQHISDWAKANNLKLNNSKSQENIVHITRRRKYFSYPSAVSDTEQVDKMNIFGITVSDTLIFHHHISVLVAHTFHAVKTTCTHGPDSNALWDVTRATLVSQLLYASPAWWGYLKADEGNQLQSIIKKAAWYSYLSGSFSSLSKLREESDEKRFSSPDITPTMFCTQAHSQLIIWRSSIPAHPLLLPSLLTLSLPSLYPFP